MEGEIFCMTNKIKSPPPPQTNANRPCHRPTCGPAWPQPPLIPCWSGSQPCWQLPLHPKSKAASPRLITFSSITTLSLWKYPLVILSPGRTSLCTWHMALLFNSVAASRVKKFRRVEEFVKVEGRVRNRSKHTEIN